MSHEFRLIDDCIELVADESCLLQVGAREILEDLLAELKNDDDSQNRTNFCTGLRQ